MDFNLLDSFQKELTTIDPVDFVEQFLTIKGNRFQLRDCGRDYLFEIYRYIAFEATKPTGVPVVVVKGRQVEMSTTATALSLFIMASGLYHHVTGLHAFPLIKTAARYSGKAFDTMVQESVNKRLYNCRAGIKILPSGKAVTDTKILTSTWSLAQKDFKDSNTLYLEGAGADGDRLRGMQIDFILYDEFQDWAKDAVSTIKEALSHSKLGPSGTGPEFYFGTPKEAESEFHKKWRQSDQRYYHLKCPDCGYYQRLTLDNFVRGNIVQCGSCKQEFDKRIGIAKGRWIATQPEFTNKMRGYHVDQLLVPDITREAIDRKLKENSNRINANEVFGNFYAGTIDELTIGKILEWTTTQPNSAQLSFPPFVDNVETVMGIDWGGRASGEEDAGKGSYTVVTILSRTFEGKYRLEYAEMLETTKLEDIVKKINALIQRYNCKEVFADHGYGHDKIDKLREFHGNNIKAVYTGGTNLKKGFSFNPEINMVTIDKHFALEEMVNFLQQYNFIFPMKDPERTDWLVEHISHIEITSVEQGGMLRKRFKKKSNDRPIDGLMSLLYAYTGMRFVATQGFAASSPMKGGNRVFPRPQLAGISRSGFARAMRQKHRRQRNG